MSGLASLNPSQHLKMTTPIGLINLASLKPILILTAGQGEFRNL
jgi:hypothetical protein